MIIPDFLLKAPRDLWVCNEPIKADELELYEDINKRFSKKQIDLSKLRAFRLMHNQSSWIEIGTESRVNLGYITQLIDPQSYVIDIDLVKDEKGIDILQSYLDDKMKYRFVQGSSFTRKTASIVGDILDTSKVSGVFIDGNHMFDPVCSDFSLYYPFVKSTGYIFFHDIFYTGTEAAKGVEQFLAWLNQYIPVWQVMHNEPLCRFMPRHLNKQIWGGIAIIRMEDIVALSSKNYI